MFGTQTIDGQAALKARGWNCWEVPDAGYYDGTDPCAWGPASGVTCDGGQTVSALVVDCFQWGNLQLGGILSPALADYVSVNTL